MVSFSTTGLLLPVALFPLGTTHDCAIGQAGPSIWSRLPPAILYRGAMRRIGLAVRSLAQPHASGARWRVLVFANSTPPLLQGHRFPGGTNGESVRGRPRPDARD